MLAGQVANSTLGEGGKGKGEGKKFWAQCGSGRKFRVIGGIQRGSCEGVVRGPVLEFHDNFTRRNPDLHIES